MMIRARHQRVQRHSGRPATRPIAPAKPRKRSRKDDVLDLLAGGSATRAELAYALDLQPISLQHYLEDLVAEGLIEPAGKRAQATVWRVTFEL